MNSVLEEIVCTGLTELPSGEKVPVTSTVPASSARLLWACIAETLPALGFEVGLAYGVSTLHILDAMTAHGGGRLIGMDPHQSGDGWRNAGLYAVHRAGFAKRYELIEEASQSALPRLAASGKRVQFGFIDGWHTFDHALVDFFYIDQMLDVGGIVALDDVQYPAIHRLCDFLLTNRDYSVFGRDLLPPRYSIRSKLKRLAQGLLGPVVRDDLTPSLEARARCAEVRGARVIALRKVADDRRAYDHFTPF